MTNGLPRFENGKLIGYRGTDKDITEQIVAIEKIKQQKEEFESIFNYSKDGIAITDMESNFLDCNEAYHNMLGYTKDELLQKSCLQLSPQEDYEKNMLVPQILSKEGEIKDFEKLCIKKDGNKIITNMSLSLLPDKKRILITVKDITDLREKDRMLTEQSKNAAMGEMIGNIAHQWRQPLSIISTGATGIKFAKEINVLTDEQLYNLCDSINDNAQYLSRTIDDFSNFIKGDRKIVNFNLFKTIGSFLRLVEGSIKNNEINVIENIESEININGFPNELIQCFMNIFNNSKDAFTDIDTKKYIFIDAYISDKNLVIKFKDNAGGIPEEILPRIFEPYFSTKHKAKGTGLGLSMTYNLITKGMHGTIEANNVIYEYENEKFKGVEFKITLPE